MRVFITLLMFFPIALSAQLSDDFSDGEFSDNPEWTGNPALFIVNPEFQLQLNSSGDGTSYLSTSFNTTGLTEWRIWTKLAFSPSDNNNTRIYLVADQSNVSEPLNGYYLKLGESGSADAIELYRQSGTAEYFICRGTDGLLANSFTMNIRVVRTGQGIWNIYADPAGGEEFQFQASGEDPTWESYSHFGILCKYTSSNATKFNFDNVYAGPAILDDIKPQLLSAEITGTDNVTLSFSEPVDAVSASNIENYNVDQGLGYPVSAVRDNISTSLVNLTFSQTITQGLVYNITVRDVADLAGNSMVTTILPFAFYNVQPFDVLINEVMADPDPPVGLPEYEYIELYNRSELPVQLENWELSIGTTKKVLPNAIIAPGSFLILTSDEAAADLSEYGTIMAFSSLSLANTGATLTLRDGSDAVIHTVAYNDDWYRDNIKKTGGWSLEQIDPSNPCGEAGNWRASNDPKGGTPGSINSVNSTNADLSAPAIEKVSISGESIIRVFFNEAMDSLSLSNPALYSVDNGLGNPLGISLYPPDYRSVSLIFGGIINSGTIYTLSMAAGFTDCAGNTTTTQLTARFAVPENIEVNDVVINEVLSDPRATGTDFVEIYNRSEKVLDLKNLWLATRDATTGELASAKETAPDGRLMFPGEYLVLTADAGVVQSEYFTPAPGAFVQMESLPSFSNEEGTVVLLTPLLTVVDEFSYYAGLHFALLNSTDGVSLERVNFDLPASEPGNWHSASQNVGFATPGYQNSQFMRPPDSGDEIVITPEIFSPDNDGYNDLLGITCNFSEPGYSVTIRIFDSNGRLIRMLVKNEPAGTSNQYTWDGITEAREKAPIGIYIIHVEVFNLSGKLKEFKKPAVLGGKF
ncbi:MAG: lamin tail domain-containing protein [Bacteroidales bacterium]|nr:lamin tail domain-containing protein [Bacteroidales bacterium]